MITLSSEHFLSYSKYFQDLKEAGMKIQLWYCEQMAQWRWILTDNRRPIVRQESGQRHDLKLAMQDVANTVEYMLSQE